MKKTLLAAMLLAISGLAAPGRIARAAETYDIPVVLSLTGYGAFLGKEEQESLQLMEHVVNDSGGIADAHRRGSFVAAEPRHFVLRQARLAGKAVHDL